MHALTDCTGWRALRDPGPCFVSSPSTGWGVAEASRIAGGDGVAASGGDDLLVGLAVEGLDVGEGVGGHDCTLGEGDIDGLGQVSAGAGGVFGVVTCAGALAISAAEEAGQRAIYERWACK